MLISIWEGIIFVDVLHRAKARFKIQTNIIPNHAKISILHGRNMLILIGHLQ
jgi:hypothetical protein